MPSRWLQRGEWQHRWRRFWAAGRHVLYRAFVTQERGVALAAGAVVLIAALYLVVTQLYLPPPYAPPAMEEAPELRHELIETAVEMTETRARAKEVGFVVPPDILGP